jgi:hypothetical protein
MSDFITFVGDPGPDAGKLLEVIRNSGLGAKRVDASDRAVGALDKEPPLAAVVNGEWSDLRAFLEGARETRSLSAVPVLLRVKEADPVLLVDAFRLGVDDFFVDGSLGQFSALIATVAKKDAWSAVRAPAGQVILAHADRHERAKVGRILQRNGFDTFFAGSTDELKEAIQHKKSRAVIVSCDIPGEPVVDMILNLMESDETLPPMVLAATAEVIDDARKKLPDGALVKYFETGTDPEGVTFVLNELLAPPPAGARRSARILWATPVSFKYTGGDMVMNGFMFNINQGGVYVRTLTSLPLQTKIEVSFRPPFGRGQVVADAQVVWRKQMGDTSGAASPPGMGLQFLELWPSDQAAYDVGYQTLLEQTSTSSSSVAPPPTKPV